MKEPRSTQPGAAGAVTGAQSELLDPEELPDDPLSDFDFESEAFEDESEELDESDFDEPPSLPDEPFDDPFFA